MKNPSQNFLIRLFFGMIILSPISFAQTPPHWRFWFVGDGLGESCSNSVVVGPGGKVWVNHGFVNEMSVLDGYSVLKIPSPAPGVRVYENPIGHLWSIHSNGFLRYEYENDLESGHWIHYPVPEIHTADTPFYPISLNRILFLQAQKILLFEVENRKTSILKRIQDTGMGEWIDMIPAHTDGIWIAGEAGIAHCRILPEMEWNEYLIPSALGVHRLRQLSEGKDGEIIGTAEAKESGEHCLLRFHAGEWSIRYQDRDREIDRGWQGIGEQFWVFFTPFSLMSLDANQKKWVDKSIALSRILIHSAVEDHGIFWLAGSEGLARYAPAAWRTPSAVADLDMVVHAIQEDSRGRIWFAFSDRLAVLEQDQWKFYPYPDHQLSDELAAESLCRLPEDRLLLKTRNQILLFDPQKQKYEILASPPDYTYSLIAASTPNRVWMLGVGQSDVRLDDFDGQNYHCVLHLPKHPFFSTNLRHIYQDSKGAIWFAGLLGLARYQQAEFQIMGTREGYGDSAAFCIYPVDDNRLWVGGRNGIYEYDGSRWSPVRLGLDSVRAVLKSRDGSIWAASRTGLHRYYQGAWVSNTLEDGLPNAAVFEIYEDQNGRIWAGTTSGLSLYHPNADLEAPRTWIPEDKNSHQIAPGGAQMVFQGIDKWKYTEAHRLLFSHRVDQEPWSVFTSDTVCPIPPLAPGSHRFAVRAMDRNWNIEAAPATFDFTVLLPWYREPHFIAIMIIGSLILSVSLFLHVSHHINLGRLVAERTQKLTQANRQLQSLSRELSLVEERERRRLAGDIHDDIGQNLALSMIKLEALQAEISFPAQIQEVDTVKHLIDQTLQHTRSLTLELCPPILYDIGFKSAVEQLSDQIHTQHGIRIHAAVPAEPIELTEDMRYFLFRSTRELLMNVVKHARVKEAFLDIHREEQQMVVQVRDAGVGFPLQNQNWHTEGFGLFSIRERLQLIGGQLMIESKPGEGTCVVMRIPFPKPNQPERMEDHAHLDPSCG